MSPSRQIEYRYCPGCGAPLSEGVRFGRTRRLCRYCGFVHLRDPKVAVAALVSEGHSVLLVRRSVEPRLGSWALPAGFMDADELPEQATTREVYEETGIRIRVSGLVAVMPLAGWSERRGILLVYGAAPNGGELGAGDDASEVGWFAPGDLPWDSLAFESTAEVLRTWADSLPLPS